MTNLEYHSGCWDSEGIYGPPPDDMDTARVPWGTNGMRVQTQD
jgi:hypothetical protein